MIAFRFVHGFTSTTMKLNVANCKCKPVWSFCLSFVAQI